MPYPPRQKPGIRAGTMEEIEEYQRRQGGGGQEPPPGLKELFREKINDLTLAFRNRAKAVARREIFALQNLGVAKTDPRLQSLDLQFNMIAGGGIKGAVMAYKVLMAYSPAPNAP